MSRPRVAPRVRIAIAALATAGSALALAGALPGPAMAAPAAHQTLTDSYQAVGTSHIKSIDADLPIAKARLVETLDVKTNHIVRGTLPIAPQTVTFAGPLGIPLRSTTTLIQASPVTGTVTPTKKGTVLKTSVSYTIKLSDVQAQLLGTWVPLEVGDKCQTAAPVVIPVSSPKGKYFDIVKGGVLTGTYTIGKFSGCAPLHLPDVLGVGSIPVNSLVPGSGTTVSLTLSHGRFVSS